MSLVRITCAVALTLALGCSSSSQSDSDGPKIDAWKVGKSVPERLLLLLGPRETTADILVLMPPPDIAATAKKLKDVMTSNPQLMLELLQNQDEYGAIIWDARMGVTKPEYERFKDLAKLSKLEKQSEAKITIEKVGNSSVKIIGLPRPSEVRINTSLMNVSTPDGELDTGEEFTPNERQFLTGRISGVNWRRKSGPAATGNHQLMKFLVAQSVDKKELWLNVEVYGPDGAPTHEYFARCPGPSE